MIAWLRAASDVPEGRRKLTGLVWALAAAVAVVIGTSALLLVAPISAAPHLVSVGLGGLGAVVGIYAAMVGGNAVEHRYGATPPPATPLGEVRS